MYGIVANTSIICVEINAVAASHPTAPALVLSLFCIVFAWHLAVPTVWVWLIPAALPVLNFMPWTGRIWLDEFDVLLLACVAVTALDDWRLSVFGTRMFLLRMPDRYQTLAARTLIDFVVAKARRWAEASA